MTGLGKLLAVLAAVAVLLLAGSYVLIESGEVVVLHTTDSRFAHETRLWIVDYAGSEWVAPGNRDNAWFARVQHQPLVELERDGERACRLAAVVDGPEALPVLERFAEKYASALRGAALLSRFLDPAGDPTDPVAVRLDPCT